MQLVFDIPNAREVELHLDRLPETIRAGLEPLFDRYAQELLGRVTGAEPAGRTGGLREATHPFSSAGQDSLHAGVSIAPEPSGGGAGAHNVKAAALEYGAHANIEVQAYARNDASVSAYHRDVNIEARHFLTGAMQDMRPQIEAEIEREIGRILTGAAA